MVEKTVGVQTERTFGFLGLASLNYGQIKSKGVAKARTEKRWLDESSSYVM